VVYVVRAGNPVFPDGLEPDAHGLVAVGGTLTVESLSEAYQKGIFPWSGEWPIPWYSPDPRLVLFPERFKVARSLKPALNRFEVRFDTDFEAVIHACETTPRDGQNGTWITPNMVAAYGELFRLGIVHTVEAYDEDGTLAGGLYGLTFGRAFFGESMFFHQRDASKVALCALCARLAKWDFHLLDCQQVTGHLMSLGAEPLPRTDFLQRLRSALEHPSHHESWSTK